MKKERNVFLHWLAKHLIQNFEVASSFYLISFNLFCDDPWVDLDWLVIYAKTTLTKNLLLNIYTKMINVNFYFQVLKQLQQIKYNMGYMLILKTHCLFILFQFYIANSFCYLISILNHQLSFFIWFQFYITNYFFFQPCNKSWKIFFILKINHERKI